MRMRRKRREKNGKDVNRYLLYLFLVPIFFAISYLTFPFLLRISPLLLLPHFLSPLFPLPPTLIILTRSKKGEKKKEPKAKKFNLDQVQIKSNQIKSNQIKSNQIKSIKLSLSTEQLR